MESAIYETKAKLILDMENKLFDEYKRALSNAFTEEDEQERSEWDSVCSDFNKIIHKLGLDEKFQKYAFGTHSLL